MSIEQWKWWAKELGPEPRVRFTLRIPTLATTIRSTPSFSATWMMLSAGDPVAP